MCVMLLMMVRNSVVVDRDDERDGADGGDGENDDDYGG